MLVLLDFEGWFAIHCKADTKYNTLNEYYYECFCNPYYDNGLFYSEDDNGRLMEISNSPFFSHIYSKQIKEFNDNGQVTSINYYDKQFKDRFFISLDFNEKLTSIHAGIAESSNYGERFIEHEGSSADEDFYDVMVITVSYVVFVYNELGLIKEENHFDDFRFETPNSKVSYEYDASGKLLKVIVQHASTKMDSRYNTTLYYTGEVEEAKIKYYGQNLRIKYRDRTILFDKDMQPICLVKVNDEIKCIEIYRFDLFGNIIMSRKVENNKLIHNRYFFRKKFYKGGYNNEIWVFANNRLQGRIKRYYY